MPDKLVELLDGQEVVPRGPDSLVLHQEAEMFDTSKFGLQALSKCLKHIFQHS